jgi:hypothetical protein
MRMNYPRNPQERDTGGAVSLWQKRREFMARDTHKNAIDEIIATCNGDARGALKALLLVNEQLECELQQLYAAATRVSISRGNSALH